MTDTTQRQFDLIEKYGPNRVADRRPRWSIHKFDNLLSEILYQNSEWADEDIGSAYEMGWFARFDFEIQRDAYR